MAADSPVLSSIADPLPASMWFIERDWLSSNNILIFDDAGATLIDSGYVKHEAMTEALVRHALDARGGMPLVRLINTHLHSDHCGGNARLAAAFGCRIQIPEGNAAAVAAWNEAELHHVQSGQRVPQFTAHEIARAGEAHRLGGMDWDLIGTPGHDEHSLLLFNRESRILISADSLWENGFGLIFPALAGDTRGFDDQAAVLDLIEGLDATLVLPGHGRMFSDFRGAIERARSRLAYQRADLQRHARYGLKVLLKFQMMDEERVELESFVVRMSETVVTRQCALQSGLQPQQAVRRAIDELVEQRALLRAGAEISNV